MLEESAFSEEGIHGHGSLFKGGENLLPGVGSEDSSDCETEVEIEISTPRLCSTEFSALRQKFPVAFRRRTSLASVCSGTSSIYSGSMIIGEVRHQRSRTEGSRYDRRWSVGGPDGLPPRPPPKENASNSEKQALAENLKRTRKKGENGYQELGKVKSDEEQKVPLKERLRRNREEMKALLAQDKLPFKPKPRERNSEKKHSNVLNGPIRSPRRSPRATNALTLQELQNPTIPPHSHRRSPRTHAGHTLLEHLKSGKHALAKQSKSPVSDHGSIGDIDSVSVQSIVYSDIDSQIGCHKPSAQLTDGIKDNGSERIPASVCGEEEIIEPVSNRRAPKLKSARRRGSPSPLTVQNVSQIHRHSSTTEWPGGAQTPSLVSADDEASITSAPQARVSSARGIRGERRNLPSPPPPPRARSASLSSRRMERVTFEDEVQHRPPKYQRSSSYTNVRDSHAHRMSDQDTHSEIGLSSGRSYPGNAKTVHKRYHSNQDLRSNTENRKGPVKLSKQRLATAANREESTVGAVPTKVGEHDVHRVVTRPPKPVKSPWKWMQSKKKAKTQASTESLLSTIPPPVSPRRLNTLDMDVTSEISYGDTTSVASMAMDDIDFDTPKQKKSKLRWKRNKGKYTPSEEFERKKLNILQSNSRSSSWSSLHSESAASAQNFSSDASGKKKKKSKSILSHFESRRNSEPVNFSDR